MGFGGVAGRGEVRVADVGVVAGCEGFEGGEAYCWGSWRLVDG